MTPPCICGKRPYASTRHAKWAHRHVGWRLRVYWCDEGQCWHVTASEKR